MLPCDPDDRQCQNERRYYQTDYSKPSPLDPRPTPRPTPPRPPGPTPPQPPGPTTPRPAGPTPPRPTPTPPGGAAKDAALPRSAAPRPLKKISTLTPEQIKKGRMIAASYEMNAQINKEMEYTGKQQATENVLLRDSDNILRQTELSDYRVIENLSDKQYLVIEKGNEVKVVFRGRAGDNTVDNTHVLDALKGKARDYTYIDNLMGELQILRPDANVEVISYSNGGPKGLYMAEKYGLPHHTIDPVIGPKEVALLANRGPDSAPLDLIRTNRPQIVSGPGQTAQQIITGGEANINTINVAPLKVEGHALNKVATNSNPIYTHDLEHFSLMDSQTFDVIPESDRGKVGIIGRNALGSVASGVVPAALASAMVEGITPDAPHEAKLAETAVTTSALTKLAAPVLGAGSASMASTMLPLYASFQAADKTGQLTDAIIPDDLQGIPREVIKGASSGAAGGLAFTGAAAAQSAATTALTSATSAGTVAAAEGVELGTFAAVEAGLVEAAEITGAAAAAEGGLNPIADAAFVATAVGATIGATIGLISGLFHH